MSQLTLKVTTPERIVFEGSITQVSVPTELGEITILPQHEALVAVLVAGELHYRVDGEEVPLAVSSGVVEVTGDAVTVLTATAERVEEIDVARAEEAKKRAEEVMTKRLDEEEYAVTTAMLERNLVRLRVARKYRHRGTHGITQEGVRKE